jgi:hypothetical protein
MWVRYSSLDPLKLHYLYRIQPRKACSNNLGIDARLGQELSNFPAAYFSAPEVSVLPHKQYCFVFGNGIIGKIAKVGFSVAD